MHYMQHLDSLNYKAWQQVNKGLWPEKTQNIYYKYTNIILETGSKAVALLLSDCFWSEMYETLSWKVLNKYESDEQMIAHL